MDFPSTIWTVIRNAAADPQGARDQVIRRYWEPVCGYASKRGLSAEDAEDMAQTVFLHVCRDGFLERADRNKGRFRGLLVAMANHLIDSWWRLKYAGGDKRAVVSLDDEGTLAVADAAAKPVDSDFNRLWAENVLARAMERLKEESDRLRTPYHAAVDAFYLKGRSYSEIAAALRVPEGQVRNYVFRGKARLSQLVRDFIREYSGSAEEYAEELRDLGEFLGAEA
ncbi:MAG: sigma-70 family RNA polymerase sigma factor [Planctomycetes bacterium]|nr:sigma-70 family RNA polymerase sigma factor [Planctomycetota bacterium]